MKSDPKRRLTLALLTIEIAVFSKLRLMPDSGATNLSNHRFEDIISALA